MTVQMPPAKGQTVAELRYAQPGDGEMNAARMAELLTALAPLQKRLEDHPIYGRLRSLEDVQVFMSCLLYTSPSPRDVEESRMPSSA